MKSFLKWLQRTLEEVAASESGEFLSERDKTRLLYAQTTRTRPAAPTPEADKSKTAQRTLWAHWRHVLHHTPPPNGLAR
jgi:hypothetical protein